MSTIKIFNDLYEFKDINSQLPYFTSSSLEEKKDAIIESLSFDHYGTAESIFIQFPELWKDFSKNDWIEVIENSINLISDYAIDPKLLNSSRFALLRLIGNYIKINPFSLISDMNLSTSEKDYCYRYGEFVASLLYQPEQLFNEELEDFSNIGHDELRDVKEALVAQGCEALPDNDEELRLYLEKK